MWHRGRSWPALPLWKAACGEKWKPYRRLDTTAARPLVFPPCIPPSCCARILARRLARRKGGRQLETVRIYRLRGLHPRPRASLRAAHMEAAAVWTLCRDGHLAARQSHTPRPTQGDFHRATTGRFALYSQTVQAMCRTFLGTVATTKERRRAKPRIRCPYKDKRYYPLFGPAQAVSRERGQVVLPIGRGRPSLVFHLNLPEQGGACRLIWRAGHAVEVVVATSCAEAGEGDGAQAPVTPGPGPGPAPTRAMVDLGEIHQAALVIFGRGIHSHKRRHNPALGQIARKRTRCQKRARRWRRVHAARRKVRACKRRQVRDLRHTGTRKVIAFCQRQGVGSPFRGNRGRVRQKQSERHHSQRMSQWKYGQDLASLTYRATIADSESFTSSERGTSSRCPVSGWKQRVRGRHGRPRCRAALLWGIATRSAASLGARWPLAPRLTFPLRLPINGQVPYGPLAGLNSQRRWLPAGTL